MGVPSGRAGNLSECKLGDKIKAQALLRLVPIDLREMALTQSGLEGSFEQLKEYILSQVGRRSTGPKPSPSTAVHAQQPIQPPAPSNDTP